MDYMNFKKILYLKYKYYIFLVVFGWIWLGLVVFGWVWLGLVLMLLNMIETIIGAIRCFVIFH